MLVELQVEMDVRVEGKNVVIDIFDPCGEVTSSKEYSIYELIKSYMEIYETDNGYIFEDDLETVEALQSELDDAFALVTECVDGE